jgi:Outer membrane protein transport protein (OMPP1/FadL/TodX)
MRIAGRIVVSIVAVTVFSLPALSQFPEDALRLATPGFGVGARALGMGNAFTSVASDYSALYWNPAGLAQLHLGEFSFGLSHLNTNDGSSFFDGNTSYSNNNTSLNTLGFVYPVEVRRGNLVFALGYSRQANFTTGVSFDGFNPVSSIIQSYAPNGGSAPGDPAGNLAWELFLADTVGRQWYSPILNRVTQSGKILEGGGLDSWSVAGAIDVAKEVSVGLTVSYLTGRYRYDRDYAENDARNIYGSASFPYDFNGLTIKDFVNGDISGGTAKIGIMYRKEDQFRIGLNVKVPTKYNVQETFGTTASSKFDSVSMGANTYGPFIANGSDEYDVLTPWVFSAGGSTAIGDLLISGDVEYTDWSSLQFDNANADVIALNTDIKDIFRSTLNWRLGAEYDIKPAGVRLRGGYIYNTSPYQEDNSSAFDHKYITAGIGVMLGESSMLDLAYARGRWDSFQVNYDRTSTVHEAVTTHNVILTFSVRY